jgi:hypothetical protein
MKNIARLISGILVLLLSLIVLPQAEPTTADTTNLLTNPGFEEGRFTEHYPNHWIAANWYRWWIHGSPLGEYTDVGNGRHPYLGEHAQIYHSWHDYTQGIYQVIDNLTPCRPYELSAYAKTHALAGTRPHTRVGLDPQGTQLTPNPDIGSVSALPTGTRWSAEKTSIYVWEQLSVMAEPEGTSLTAIYYAAPRYPGPENSYYDTFWDAGALVPASYGSGRLPGPLVETQDFITNVHIITNTHSITVSWETAAPASTQIWYNQITPTEPFSPTEPLTYTTYLPLISNESLDFDHATGVNYMQSTTHQALIDQLESGQIINLVILARHLKDGACVTEYVHPKSVRLSD